MRHAELRVHDRRSMWGQLEVLQGLVHDGDVLRRLGLRLGSMLPKRLLQGVLPLAGRLSGQPVLRSRHERVHRELPLHERRSVWDGLEVLHGPVQQEPVLRGRRLQRGPVLPKRLVQGVLQGEC